MEYSNDKSVEESGSFHVYMALIYNCHRISVISNTQGQIDTYPGHRERFGEHDRLPSMIFVGSPIYSWSEELFPSNAQGSRQFVTRRNSSQKSWTRYSIFEGFGLAKLK